MLMSVLKGLVDVNRHAPTLMAHSLVAASWDMHWIPMELTAMVAFIIDLFDVIVHSL